MGLKIANISVSSFIWRQKNLSYFSGKDLPDPIGAGARMSQTASNKGLLMTHENDVYSFYCESDIQCYWRMEEFKLKIKRADHVMMTVPSSLVKNCNWDGFTWQLLK